MHSVVYPKVATPCGITLGLDAQYRWDWIWKLNRRLLESSSRFARFAGFAVPSSCEDQTLASCRGSGRVETKVSSSESSFFTTFTASPGFTSPRQ